MLTLKNQSKKLATASVLAVGLSLTGCTSVAELSGATTGNMNAEAAKSYTAMVNQARSQGELDTTSSTARRVQTIFNRMKPYANQANKTGVAFNWEMNVLKDDEMNAFAMPGGKMVVNTGIVEKLNLTDDEIAAVIGHEMTHALLEHSKKDAGQRVLTGLAMNVGGALLMSETGIDASTASLATDLVGNYGIDKPFSRSQENQADAGGVRLMAQAGYNPQAAITVWQKMTKAEGDRGGLATLASTHPNHAQRITAIQKMLPSVMPIYQAATKPTVSSLSSSTLTISETKAPASKATSKTVKKPKAKR